VAVEAVADAILEMENRANGGIGFDVGMSWPKMMDADPAQIEPNDVDRPLDELSDSTR